MAKTSNSINLEDERQKILEELTKETGESKVQVVRELLDQVNKAGSMGDLKNAVTEYDGAIIQTTPNSYNAWLNDQPLTVNELRNIEPGTPINPDHLPSDIPNNTDLKGMTVYGCILYKQLTKSGSESHIRLKDFESMDIKLNNMSKETIWKVAGMSEHAEQKYISIAQKVHRLYGRNNMEYWFLMNKLHDKDKHVLQSMSGGNTIKSDVVSDILYIRE